MTRRHQGTPMVKHIPLPVDADRLEQTAREICPPESASQFAERARRIASSLEPGIANANRLMLGLCERSTRQ